MEIFCGFILLITLCHENFRKLSRRSQCEKQIRFLECMDFKKIYLRQGLKKNFFDCCTKEKMSPFFKKNFNAIIIVQIVRLHEYIVDINNYTNKLKKLM